MTATYLYFAEISGVEVSIKWYILLFSQLVISVCYHASCDTIIVGGIQSVAQTLCVV